MNQQSTKKVQTPMEVAMALGLARKENSKQSQEALATQTRKYYEEHLHNRENQPVEGTRVVHGSGKPSAKPTRRKSVNRGEESFGTIIAGSPTGEIGDLVEGDGFTVAPYNPKDRRPREVVLTFAAVRADNVRLLRVTRNEAVECTDEIKLLRVKLKWEKGVSREVAMPDGVNDVNFVFLKPDGSFIQYEVAAMTREVVNDRGRRLRGFFLSIQESWVGWAAETDAGVAFIPGKAENAYPGADYVKSAVGGQHVLDAAAARGMVAKKDSVQPAVWEALFAEVPAAYRAEGYVPAIVQWFNISGGYGKLVLEDGRVCFARMSVILDEDGLQVLGTRFFPMLFAMEYMAVVPEMTSRGLNAKAVRPF